MQSYRFNGHRIEVEFRAFHTFCWLCAGLVVHADGRTFWPRPDGGPSLTTTTEFELVVGGERITGAVRTLEPLWLVPRVKCAVTLAGTEVSRGVQPLERWLPCYIAWTIVVSGMAFALIGLAVFAYLVWRAILFA